MCRFAVLRFFEDKGARSILTYSARSYDKVSEETAFFACMTAALQKSAEYIEALARDEAVLPDSVFETSTSLGSECLKMKLFDELLQDLFPTVYLRSVLCAAYKHIHAARMRQKHLSIFDSSARPSSVRIVYFCKQKPVSVTSASMILDGSVLLFGVIAPAAIQSTISLMNDLWRPILDLDRSAWGSLEFERMQDLFRARASTTDLLLQAVRESASGIQLAFPDESLDIDHIPVHKDAVNLELQAILIAMIASWCDQIDAALAHNDSFFHDSSLPPVEEIDYWTNRCDALSGIEEQLKARERRHCVALVGILENKPALAIGKRFRHAEKALAEHATEAMDTKLHLTPFKRIAVSIQRLNIVEIVVELPELMELISSLALGCRRYGPGLPISLYLSKFSRSIERCIVVHLRDDFVSTSAMFWSRPICENALRLVQSIACIDKYLEAVGACRARIHAQQVSLNSQNYSAASKAPLPPAILENVACQSLVKFKQVLLKLQSALQWQALFKNRSALRGISALQLHFDNFDASFENLVSLDLGDMFDVQSKQFTTVLSNLRLAKDALFDACLGHINTELQAQETVARKIDILDLHRELLEQAGQAAMTMIAEHSLVIVQVRFNANVLNFGFHSPHFLRDSDFLNVYRNSWKNFRR